MSSKNVILTGFMGTGKSAVGQALARRLGYRFVDSDALIEEQVGKTVAEIFSSAGEATFRELERAVSAQLASEKSVVIATGGRLMLDPQNARQLGSSGRVFCLTASPDEILKRLRTEEGKRPLLDVADPRTRIKELLAERATGYGQFAQIDTDDKSVEEVAREIERIMKANIIEVRYPHGRYNVLIGSGLLENLRDLVGIDGPMAVITDSNVGPLYQELVSDGLVITMPAGEKFKTLATVNELYSKLLAAGLDRQGTVIALGGGVVGDVAGFAAATYMRGVNFVQAPTSLLAMVDASVGAKTGVDLPEGKNLVGSFKQPEAVLADLETLRTLPDVEFSSGMAEVIKSGIIDDANLFELIESQAEKLTSGKDAGVDLLAEIVGRSVEVKRKIVEEDPFEKGRRAVLNLGHTFGHAVEQVSGYTVRHGEAVAMGMVAAAHLSAAMGYCDPGLEPRIAVLLQRTSLPVRIPGQWAAEEIYAAMASDKKRAAGRLRFILVRDIGDVLVADHVAENAVLETLCHCGAA